MKVFIVVKKCDIDDQSDKCTLNHILFSAMSSTPNSPAHDDRDSQEHDSEQGTTVRVFSSLVLMYNQSLYFIVVIFCLLPLQTRPRCHSQGKGRP